MMVMLMAQLLVDSMVLMMELETEIAKVHLSVVLMALLLDSMMVLMMVPLKEALLAPD